MLVTALATWNGSLKAEVVATNARKRMAFIILGIGMILKAYTSIYAISLSTDNVNIVTYVHLSIEALHTSIFIIFVCFKS